MKTQFARFIIASATLLAGSAYAGNPDASPRHGQAEYFVTNFASLGGMTSRGNSINNRGWIAGFSDLEENQNRHATLWLYGFGLDLGTLGGPNSSVAWSQAMNNRGLIAGIAQTSMPEPLGQDWSCSAFFPAPNATGFTCQAVVWERGTIRALPRLGGHNSFATGVNSRGKVAGWSETDVRDTSCSEEDSNQVLQFLPVIWGPGQNQVREMPLIEGDSAGAVTGLNDRGQAVGISGICDVAVGRHTARHAVLWEKGTVKDLGNLGGDWWNTPTAINRRGDIAGFLGDPDDPDGFLQAFLWTRKDGIVPLGTLSGQATEHVHSEAYGINERRQVVGLSCDAEFVDCRAFVWQDGVMTDLNSVTPGYDDLLLHARDINDQGMITGYALDANNGERSTYWAIPLPFGTGLSDDKGEIAAPAGGDRVARTVLPDDVMREILHPLSSGRVKLSR